MWVKNISKGFQKTAWLVAIATSIAWTSITLKNIILNTDLGLLRCSVPVLTEGPVCVESVNAGGIKWWVKQSIWTYNYILHYYFILRVTSCFTDLLVSVNARVVPHSMESCALGGESARVVGVDAMWSQWLRTHAMVVLVNVHQTQTSAWILRTLPWVFGWKPTCITSKLSISYNYRDHKLITHFQLAITI